MKKKVLVLGSTGLIGHQVYDFLKDNSDYELHDISFREKLNKNTLLVNARDELNLVNHISEISPEYIVNCIGVLIKGSEKDPENAIFLNAYLPHRLMRLADELNARLIHMSTDCVFSGDKKGPYLEGDEKDGKGIYARTKGFGEIINDRHLTIRTSVVGPELKTNGEELFHWFMSQKDEISGFKKSIWSGVTTFEVAKAIRWAIDENIVGLYHLTNNESINKSDLLKLFLKYTGQKNSFVEIDGKITDKSFIDTRGLINYPIPSYDKMINDMIGRIDQDQDRYSQYYIRR